MAEENFDQDEWIIEIMSEEKIQLFRTVNAYHDTPYSLEELYTTPHDHLFVARADAHKKFNSCFNRALKGEQIWLREPELWEHQVEAVLLERPEVFKSWYIAFVPLMDQNGKIGHVMSIRSRKKPSLSGPVGPQGFKGGKLVDFLKSVGHGLIGSALYDVLKWTFFGELRVADLKSEEMAEIIHLFEARGIVSLKAA